mmetsp:Transcript_27492/g.49112  ORF Transcript_27492/g.49112 Transcript_27492/m.49112 type:complete len:315 (-) Transcript_27492:221-1165(-)
MALAKQSNKVVSFHVRCLRVLQQVVHRLHVPGLSGINEVRGTCTSKPLGQPRNPSPWRLGAFRLEVAAHWRSAHRHQALVAGAAKELPSEARAFVRHRAKPRTRPPLSFKAELGHCLGNRPKVQRLEEATHGLRAIAILGKAAHQKGRVVRLHKRRVIEQLSRGPEKGFPRWQGRQPGRLLWLGSQGFLCRLLFALSLFAAAGSSGRQFRTELLQLQILHIRREWGGQKGLERGTQVIVIWISQLPGIDAVQAAARQFCGSPPPQVVQKGTSSIIRVLLVLGVFVGVELHSSEALVGCRRWLHPWFDVELDVFC